MFILLLVLYTKLCVLYISYAIVLYTKLCMLYVYFAISVVYQTVCVV
jgi:hypothetical protein